MRVKVIHPRIVLGTRLVKGTEHDLTAEQVDHWFTRALIKEGDLVAVAEVPAPKSAASRPPKSGPMAKAEKHEAPAQPRAAAT